MCHLYYPALHTCMGRVGVTREGGGEAMMRTGGKQFRGSSKERVPRSIAHID